MKELKVVRLLLGLSQEDISLCHDKLKVNRRKTMYELFKNILKISPEDLEKELVYLKVFKKPYKEKDDYLFRNECRLLLNEVEEILVEQAFKKEIKSKTNLYESFKVKLYQKPSTYDLYEDEARNLVKKYEVTYDWDNAHKLRIDLYEVSNFYINKYEDRTKFLGDFVQSVWRYTVQSTAQKLAFGCMMDANYAFMQGELHWEKKSGILSMEDFITEVDQVQTPLTKTYQSLANWYPNFSIKNTEDLELILEQLQSNADLQADIIIEEKRRLLFLIATNYSMSGNFEMSDMFFKRLFNEIPSDKLSNPAYFKANYITNLYKMCKYQEALEAIEQVNAYIGNSELLKSRYHLIRLICYMNLRDSKALKALIPHDFSEVKQDYKIYYRLLNIIYFYLEGEFEIAAEDCQNLIRTKIVQEWDRHFVSAIDFIGDFLNFVSKYEHLKKVPEKEIKQLKAKIEFIDTHEIPLVVNYGPYVFFKKELTGIE